LGLLVYDAQTVTPIVHLRNLLRTLRRPGFELILQRQDPLHSWLCEQSSSLLQRSEPWTTITLKDTAGFAQYWAQRPKELQENLRRRSHRAVREGMKRRLVKVDQPDEVARAVDRYGELESRGWKGREGTALHPSNQQGAFYREFLRTRAGRGGACVYELYLNDRLAASRLLVSSPSMHIILKTTHDEDLRQYAVGHLQLFDILQDLLAQPSARPIELYTNATRDWLLWATHTRKMEHVSVYRNTLAARAARIGRALRSARRARQPLDAEHSEGPGRPRRQTEGD
jgi:hypothetical protein